MKKKLLSMVVSLGIGALSLAGCANVGITSRYDGADLYSKGGAEIEKTIDAIEIHWISGSVAVEYDDGNTVRFSETANTELTDDTSLYFRLEGKTLKLQYMRSGARGESKMKKDLIVCLPREMKPKKLSVETVSASVSLQGLCVGKIEIETSSGTVDAKLAQIGELSLETVSGNAELRFPTIGTLEIDAVSASVNAVALDAAPRRMEAESVSGDITLRIPKTDGFSLKHETVSGDFHCDFPYEKKANLYLVSGGNCSYDVESTSGDLSILYAEETN